ncbi:MAG TPA: two-component regulator propeller domain-containing protein, partial [Cytophagales bacterium]
MVPSPPFLLSLLAGLLGLLPAAAQVSFERLGPAQGMPQSTLHALHQDRAGFLWMATRDGLNRYDGQTFRTWRGAPDQPGSLGSSDVSVVGGDRAGRTWVGTINGGLYYLNPDGRTFTHFPLTTTGADVSRRTINCLAEAADGRIWAATAGQGWLIADARTGRVEEFRLGNAAEHPQVIGHLADRDGSLWFGLEGGLLVHFPRGADRPATFRLPGRAPTAREATVTAIFRDRRGNLWVGSRSGGLYRLREAAGQFEPVYREPGVAGKGNFVKCLAEDRQGTLWVGTDDGIRLLPGGDPRRVVALHPNPADPHSLATHPIQCLLTDREGNVWVGTWEGGLHVAYAEPPRFEAVGDQQGASRSGPPPKTTALALDPAGELWAGSVRGISRFTAGQGPNAPAGTLVPVTPPVSPG